MSSAKITKTTCPYCGVGCGVEVSQKSDGTVSVQGDPQHPANFGRLCSKGSALADTIALENRLLHPSVAGKQASWDEALAAVSDGFSKVIKEHGPDAVAFYVSGQLLTEDYYVANKLMKGFIGSANIDTNSRLCMSSAVAGYKRAFGVDAVPCNYDDLEQADLLVITGSNLAWCHPIVFQRIVQAKEQRPNMKVVVIDPRQTATCDIADLHLALKPGSDAVLFNGLLAHLSDKGYLDDEFLEHHVDGAEQAIRAAIESTGDIESLAEQCGLTQKELNCFFDWFADTEKVVTLYSQGVNQSSSGTDKSNGIINCHLATGRLGKSAMGPFSITGQPNAMGGREVGGLSNQLAAHMELDNPKHQQIVSDFWQTDNLALTAGAKAVDMFDDIASGKIKAIWVMATNPVVSMPNANHVLSALQQCELVVVSDCEAQTDTIACADVLLPALAWGEKSGTVTNSERRISRQRAFLPPAGEAKPDWWIISQVAKRMGFSDAFPYQNSNDIFCEHAALSGYENNGSRDFDISLFSNITDIDYDVLKPIQWPATAIADKGTERLFTDKKFFTKTGRAQMIAIVPRPHVNQVSESYPLLLNTGRVRDQWHTMTRTARSAKLNAHIAEPLVEVHPEDADKLSLQQGDLAKIKSDRGQVLARVQITGSQNKGNVFIPIHWNGQFASLAKVGTLIAPEVDPISGQPEFKQTPVSLEPFKAKWYGFILSRQQKDIEPLLSTSKLDYWVKIKGQQFWRYELAGEKALIDIGKLIELLTDQLDDCIEYQDSANGVYRVAQLSHEQLQFVAMFSQNKHLPARSWVSQLFSEPNLDEEMRAGLLAGKPGAGVPDTGPIVCACFGVGENTLIEKIKSGEATSVDKIGECLKAGTNCGSCLPELKNLVQTHGT